MFVKVSVCHKDFALQTQGWRDKNSNKKTKMLGQLIFNAEKYSFFVHCPTTKNG